MGLVILIVLILATIVCFVVLSVRYLDSGFILAGVIFLALSVFYGMPYIGYRLEYDILVKRSEIIKKEYGLDYSPAKVYLTKGAIEGLRRLDGAKIEIKE